jgi:hypothetical protein
MERSRIAKQELRRLLATAATGFAAAIRWITLTATPRSYFSESVNWTWRASFKKQQSGPYLTDRETIHGSRSAIGNTHRWRAVRSC